MRIINKQPFERKFICEGCGSELAAETNDIIGGWINERRVYYATCPVCGERHAFKRDTLPKGIIDQADLKG